MSNSVSIPATKKFSLVVNSTIIRSEKGNKPIEAILSNNPHQMNRVIGYLADGTKVCIAQRKGKGGMDFNKLVGGKVFAVAADGMSPVFEKDDNGKPTKNQKQEDGLPLYSSSGFYTLSTKEYPALDMFEAYMKLSEDGSQAFIVTEAQLATKSKAVLSNEEEVIDVYRAMAKALNDDQNLVARFDEAINKKRQRGIERAKQEAEDAEEEYAGVGFKPLMVSNKDGNPFILYVYKVQGEAPKAGAIKREELVPEGDFMVGNYFGVKETLARFKESEAGIAIMNAVNQGKTVEFGWVQGHIMRTSVSFKRKVINFLEAPESNAVYGDAVFIKAALKGWTKGLMSILFSQHPNFPTKDYDSHPYVVSCRQAVIGMDRVGDSGWTPPQGVLYKIVASLLD